MKTLYLSLIGMAASVTAPAQSEPALKRLFQDKYLAYEKAFLSKDQAFLPRLLAPDYSAEQPGQPLMNRDTTIKMFSGLSAATQGGSWKRDIQKVTLKDGKAVVLFNSHFKGKLVGPGGKPHDVEFRATNEDTWVKLAGDWKIEHSKVLKFSMTPDRKPSR